MTGMKRIVIIAAAAVAVAAAIFSCKDRKSEVQEETPSQPDTVLVGHSWTEVDPLDLELKPVANFSQDWMALATGSEKQYNAMTISWGGIGELWGRPVVTVYVSADRASKRLMDENEYFTVTGFPPSFACKNALVYIGSHSMRDDPDKCANAGLTVEFTDLGNPIFAEGRLAIECRKLYSAPFDLNRIPQDIRERLYGELAVHTMYIGEIVNVWEKR